MSMHQNIPCHIYLQSNAMAILTIKHIVAKANKHYKAKVYIGVNTCNDIVAPKFIINKLQTTDSVIFDEFWYRTL